MSLEPTSPSDPTSHAAWRILDANANRCAEALRTWEEYVRFVRESPPLTASLKEARHQLASVLDRLPWERRLAARNVEEDPGTRETTESERRREQPADVARAAAARASQALRCLEEYSKLVCPSLADAFERLRYAVYAIEQRTFGQPERHGTLADVRVCLLADCRQVLDQIVPQVEAYLDAGAAMIQLRDKETDDRELLRAARELCRVRPQGLLVIVNDRPDIAAIADTDGVHVGQEDLPAAEARRIVGPTRLVGVSTHEVGQLSAAVQQGADYVGFGPVFPTPTKDFTQFVGPVETGRMTERSPLPLFAIGGITPDNLGELTDAGVGRVAVSSAVWNSRDPLETLRKITKDLRRVPLTRELEVLRRG